MTNQTNCYNCGKSSPTLPLAQICLKCLKPLRKAQKMRVRLGSHNEYRYIKLKDLFLIDCTDHKCTFTYRNNLGELETWTPHTRLNLSALTSLEEVGLCRINRWQIVNLAHIYQTIKGDCLRLHSIDNKQLLIGQMYMDNLQQNLQRWNIPIH